MSHGLYESWLVILETTFLKKRIYNWRNDETYNSNESWDSNNESTIWAPNWKRLSFFGGAISVEIKEIIDACILEVTGYKERVENLLCETDIKEQDHL